MKRFEFRVYQPVRLFIGIISLGISVPGLLFMGSNPETSNLKILILIMLFLLIVRLVYFTAFGKLILLFSQNRIDFEWKKRFLFEKRDIESVNFKDINTLIVDNGVFLRKIITKDRVIDINIGKPIPKDFWIPLEFLIHTVEANNGRVIDSNQNLREKGYYDASFRLTIILLALSIFLISRLWFLIEFQTLWLLFLPLIAYLKHVKMRINKKNLR